MEFETKMYEIAKKADEQSLLYFDRNTFVMDLEIAHEAFNLDLDEFLKADDFNFTHDVIEIQNHVDRENRTMKDIPFVPRFATAQ